MLFPLRIAIPVLLMVFAAVIGMFTLWHNSRLAAERVERTALAELTREMTQLQGTLDYLMQIDAADRLQEEIAAQAVDPAVQTILLLDDRNMVLAAGRRALIGLSFMATLSSATQQDIEYIIKTTTNARNNYTGSVRLIDNGQTAVGVYPVTLTRKADELRSSRVGILYILKDLTPQKDHARRAVEGQAAQYSLLLVALALALWGISHITVTRRLNRLLTATTRLASGDFSIRSGVRGRDELAVIGRAFDEMADQLQQNRLALQDQEERLRLLLDSTAEAIYGIDLHGVCTFCNPATLRLLGYRNPDEVLGKNIHALIHHSHRDGTPYPEAACPIALSFRQEGVQVDDEVFWRADGSSFPVEYRAHPIVKDGQTVGSVVTFLDITKRRIAEERLFEEKERAQVTLHSIGDAVITTDAQGCVDYLNPVAEKLTAWSAAEARGRPLSEIFRVVNEITRQPPSFNPVERCLQEGKVIGLANRSVLINRNNMDIAVEDSAAPIRNHSGAIIGIVIVFHDVSAAREMAHRLTWQAAHDALTGLINRGAFEERLNRAIAAAKQSHGMHSLLYLDLDQFKVVNDTCGHVAGDELLKQLATLLNAQVRDDDTFARLGGDEFGILMENCPADQARRIAENLCRTAKDFRFVWEGKTFEVGISIGLVEIDEHTLDSMKVMSGADMACYMAKEGGRNRVHVYREADEELGKRHSEMQWVARLNVALQHDRFVLHSQDIIPLNDSASEIHCEILVRLVDEVGKLVPPGAFIPAAERYNLMPALDRWVVRRMFEYIAESRQNLPMVRADGAILRSYAINLSGVSLNDPHFLGFIREQFRRHRIAPNCICFEITETAVISHLPEAIRFMNELKGMGCRFALDDFGSGVSSFAYLKNLPVDFLKIDGSFVRDIAVDPIDLAMVESINQIGHVMGMKTIAEFVENDDILEILRGMGVDYGQGYGIEKPKPLTAAEGGAKLLGGQIESGQ